MAQQQQGARKEVTGTILNIKTKETKKGEAATYLCQTKSRNKFWFMGWLMPWYANNGDVDLSEFVVGQEITVAGMVNADGIKQNEDGTSMMFIAPNPKLIRKSPITAEMQTQKEFRQRLAPFDNERLASAIQGLVEVCADVLDSDDDEFVRSLADGAKKYGSITDPMRPHIIRLCAKYVTKNTKWRNTVEESIKTGGSLQDEHRDSPYNDPNADFDDNVAPGGVDDPPF